MPINEILANCYLKFTYQTLVATHKGRLYFNDDYTTDTESGELGVSNRTDASFTPFTEILLEYANRLNGIHQCNIKGFSTIELWRSVTGADNEFVAYVPSPDVPLPSNGSVASSYVMYVYGTPTRRKTRLTIFDFYTSVPQRYPASPVGSTDTGSIHWYILRSGVPFSNEDGQPLTTLVSENTGYNRKLARLYGRQIEP